MPHIHELIDWTVEVYIVHKNKVLLRLHEKYNIWLGVGGHIELDEEPNQACIREVKEEVGLDIELFKGEFIETKRNGDGYKDLIPPYFMNYHNINERHNHIALIYFAKAISNNVIPENINDKWLWLTKSELENMYGLNADVKTYALKALEILT